MTNCIISSNLIDSSLTICSAGFSNCLYTIKALASSTLSLKLQMQPTDGYASLRAEFYNILYRILIERTILSQYDSLY